MFFVIAGILGVKTENGCSRLLEGQSFTVEPGVKHEFFTYDMETTIVEVAYVDYNHNDIHRERLGGKTNATEYEQKAKGSV